jgi:acyl-coenzyme A thioesterase PaaI-like protein
LSDGAKPSSDGELHRRILESFSRQGLLRALRAELARVEPGSVEIRMPFHDGVTQQHGFAHAGAVTSIADTACGFAALTLMPPDAAVLTV